MNQGPDNTAAPSVVEICSFYQERLHVHGDSRRAAHEALIEDHIRHLNVSPEVAERLADGRYADALATFAREQAFTEAEWFALLLTARELTRLRRTRRRGGRAPAASNRPPEGP